MLCPIMLLAEGLGHVVGRVIAPPHGGDVVGRAAHEPQYHFEYRPSLLASHLTDKQEKTSPKLSATGQPTGQ